MHRSCRPNSSTVAMGNWPNMSTEAGGRGPILLDTKSGGALASGRMQNFKTTISGSTQPSPPPPPPRTLLGYDVLQKEKKRDETPIMIPESERLSMAPSHRLSFFFFFHATLLSIITLHNGKFCFFNHNLMSCDYGIFRILHNNDQLQRLVYERQM